MYKYECPHCKHPTSDKMLEATREVMSKSISEKFLVRCWYCRRQYDVVNVVQKSDRRKGRIK